MPSSPSSTLLARGLGVFAAVAMTLVSAHAAGQTADQNAEVEARSAELSQTRALQQRYAEATAALDAGLGRAQKSYAELIVQFSDGAPLTGLSDPRFPTFSRSLVTVRREGLEAALALYSPPPKAPRVPKSSPATRVLIPADAAERFSSIEAELAARIPGLEDDRRAAQRRVADYYHHQALSMTAAFVDALRASPELRGQLRSVRDETGRELNGEAVHVVLRLGHWTRQRLDQLRALPGQITYRNIVALLWDVSKFLLLLMVLVMALRRWERWMRSAIGIIGRSLTYGRSAILLVRLLESAKTFGPPLLVLAAALASYWVFSSVSDEAELALQLVIAVSALRVQLRLVQSASEGFERRRREREAERALLEEEKEAERLAEVAAAATQGADGETTGGREPRKDRGADGETAEAREPRKDRGADGETAEAREPRKDRATSSLLKRAAQPSVPRRVGASSKSDAGDGEPENAGERSEDSKQPQDADSSTSNKGVAGASAEPEEAKHSRSGTDAAEGESAGPGKTKRSKSGAAAASESAEPGKTKRSKSGAEAASESAEPGKSRRSKGGTEAATGSAEPGKPAKPAATATRSSGASGPGRATRGSGSRNDAPPNGDQEDLEPFWALVAKTWRRLTRYVSVFVVLLVVANFAVGRGVFYGLLLRWAWLGAIPLTLFFLRTWRPRIVHEVTLRADSDRDQSLLGRLARRHSHRIYGLPIVFAAFIVVLGRRSATFVKRHFFELNSTKRALAFLFRRSVQKHAREHGRVLEKPQALPEAITRQFGPLEVSELAPLAKTVLPELLGYYESWREDGVDGSVALVGPSGMGKTCLMERFSKEVASELDGPLDFLRLEEKITKPIDLVRWLASELDLEGEPGTERALIGALRKGRRRVVMIDSCHHLFLRQVGGFAAWDSFVRIVNETGARIFWLVSVGKAAWDYLGNVSGNVAYFRKVIKMPAWSETELRRLILGRMRRSGYRVNFSDLLVTRIDGVHMTSQIIRTSQGYFRLLWDYSNGNPTLAAFFWLRSLVPESTTRSVRVNLFAAPRIDELEKLPDDIAFVLTAVVEHESASASELERITNLSLEFCRFAVRYSRERGYLERRGKRVVLSRLWRETVIVYLKRKHLLYS